MVVMVVVMVTVRVKVMVAVMLMVTVKLTMITVRKINPQIGEALIVMVFCSW